MGIHNLDLLFKPRAVAVIGASSNAQKVSGRPVPNLIRHGFQGAIYPVNPSVADIHGIPCWPNIASIPESFDTAFIALPADQVETALIDCARRGARAVIIYSSGFAEAGEAGLALQQRIVESAAAHSVRLAGPNSLGIMNMRDRVMLSASTAPTELELPSGHIGLVSQSGALGGALLARGSERGIAFRFAATSGNEADIDLAEYLDWMLEDPQTRVLATLFEGLRRPREFVALCLKAADRGVPVVALRIGRSLAGQRAAASHTGSMLDDVAAFQAKMRQLGVRLVEDLDTLVETAGLLSRVTDPVKPHHRAALKGAGVAVVSHSGGGAILLTDLLSEQGLPIAEFSTQTCADLKGLLPGWGSAQNPLDLTTASLTDRVIFESALATVAADPQVAALALVMSNTAARAPSQHDALRRFHQTSDKPCAIYVIDGQTRTHMQILRDEGLAIFDSGTALAQVLRAVLSRETFASGSAEPAPDLSVQWLARLAAAPHGFSEPEAKALFATFDIPSPPGILVHTAAQAIKAAAEIGYPVVLKLVAEGVVHKSELGGVKINLKDAAEVRLAFDQIMHRVAPLLNAETLRGVWVERMQTPVAELIVGARRHPDFGTSILVGMGGMFAEVFGDTAVRSAPVSLPEAHGMLRQLKSFPVLNGARNRPKADIAAAAQAIVRVSQLAHALGDKFEELEINPLGVDRIGGGVFALDAVLLPSRPENG